MLKMTHLRSKKQKCQKEIKRLLALGDITPRTKSNLLETFVSKDIQFFFQVKLQKNLLNTAGSSCIVCHWNMHCSGTTHLHFCIKHLAKEFLKKKIIPNIPQKQTKNLPWKLRNLKTCLKWRTWGVKNKNVKKIKGLLVLGDITPRTKSFLLETFVSNRY